MNVAQAALPFSGRGVHSRHASYTGAVVARKSRGVKTQLYLQWLRRHGPATDHEAWDGTGIFLTSINSIRNTLAAAGLIESAGLVEGADGAKRTLWRVKEA